MSARRSILIVALSGVIAFAQEPAPPVFNSGASAVMVDVVVRDKKGNPVTGLTRADFELLEDGVRQEIGDLTVVGGASASTGPASGTSSAEAGSPPPSQANAGAEPMPTFTALVFDRLSPDARVQARLGGRAAVEAVRGPSDFVGIYLADLSLVTLQPYTTDRERLRAAVDALATRVTGASSPDAKSDSLAVMRLPAAVGGNSRDVPNLGTAGGDPRPSVDVVASAESPGRSFTMTNGTRRLSPEEATMAAVLAENRTHAAWEGLSRERDGRATINALLAVTAGLSALPGRKTIVFFAEGLAIPDAVLPQFANIVAAANRANVSIYTVDAAGLRAHSSDAETGREVAAMGAAGLTLGPDGSNMSSLGMMERNEDVLRRDPRTSLTMLAEQTGGFLVANTNDLSGAYRTIENDRRSYYLLTYVPKNTNFDGQWRTLAVRIPGRKVQVRARTGYLAVRSAGILPVLAYEAPALVELDKVPARRDFPVRVGGLRRGHLRRRAHAADHRVGRRRPRRLRGERPRLPHRLHGAGAAAEGERSGRPQGQLPLPAARVAGAGRGGACRRDPLLPAAVRAARRLHARSRRPRLVRDAGDRRARARHRARPRRTPPSAT